MASAKMSPTNPTKTMTAAAANSHGKLAQVPERFVKNHVKTRMCSFFLQKKCLRGNSCKFAHNQRELRSAPDYTKTRFCEVFFQTGECPSLETCLFAHSQEELRVKEPRKVSQAQTGRYVEVAETKNCNDGEATAWRPGARSRKSSGSSDSDNDSHSEDDEPLVTKSLTASTACTTATRGSRRNWADVMDDEDDDDDVNQYCESWTSSTAAGTTSSGLASSPLSFLSTLDKNANHDDFEVEVEVEYLVKNSFFHLQPAGTRSASSRVRSSSTPALLRSN